MTRVVLLRHAHAEPAQPGQADFDRPLSLTGRDEAVAAGRWLRDHDVAVEAVLCSPARRARETLEGARMHWPGPTERLCPGLYEATPGGLVRELEAAAAGSVLLIGHNPGLEELAALLAAGRSGDRRGLPPGGIAVIECPPGTVLEPGRGRVEAFWSP